MAPRRKPGPKTVILSKEDKEALKEDLASYDKNNADRRFETVSSATEKIVQRHKITDDEQKLVARKVCLLRLINLQNMTYHS